MRKKNGVRGSYHSAWMAILLPVLACAPAPDDAVDPKQAQPLTTSADPIAAAPSYQDLANATFTGIIGQPVQLVNGLWEGEPFAEGGASRPRVGLAEDFISPIDLVAVGLMSAEQAHDLHYVQNWSFAFDLKILLRTIAGGFLNKNAY